MRPSYFLSSLASSPDLLGVLRVLVVLMVGLLGVLVVMMVVQRVVVVKQHMPQGGLNGGRLYTGGSGRGQAR